LTNQSEMKSKHSWSSWLANMGSSSSSFKWWSKKPKTTNCSIK